jgi:Ca2+-binding EF-hand superfamily protein
MLTSSSLVPLNSTQESDMNVSSATSSYASYGAMQPPPPPPDSESIVEELMASYDSDGDGTLSSDEFSAAAAANGTEDAETLLAQLDSSGDSLLSSEELLAAIEASKPEPPQGMGPPPPPPESSETSEERLEALFAELDTDGDGSISSEEFLAGAPDTSDASAVSETDESSNTSVMAQTLHNQIFASLYDYYLGSDATTQSA